MKALVPIDVFMHTDRWLTIYKSLPPGFSGESGGGVSRCGDGLEIASQQGCFGGVVGGGIWLADSGIPFLGNATKRSRAEKGRRLWLKGLLDRLRRLFFQLRASPCRH